MIILVFCTLIGGSVWMALALLISNQPLQWNLIQNNSTFNMAYLIVGATLVTVYLYQVTTVALSPSRVNAYTYLNPVLVAILLLLIDGVSIPMSVIPGILISIAVAVVLQCSNKNETSAVLSKT